MSGSLSRSAGNRHRVCCQYRERFVPGLVTATVPQQKVPIGQPNSSIELKVLQASFALHCIELSRMNPAV
eukprot:scaffold17673_cov140-Skeletonema_marinoi.AAC.3